jgi:Carboxypeptidase regulatory-like domain/TonB-dependent Receptor Plug Domain
MRNHGKKTASGITSTVTFRSIPTFEILPENISMKKTSYSVSIPKGNPGTARYLLWAMVVMMLLPLAARAQDAGSITGTVRDSSGAVVADAEVKVTNPTIGITRTTTTNPDGDFLAAALPPGKYDLSVTAPGFKVFQAKNIVVRVADKARVDVALQVGQVTENVVVEGENVAQVETQSSEISGVVTGKEISQLELNGRNFTQLVTLVPGVSNQTGQDESEVGLNGNISYSINGGRGEYNNWQVDGANNMDTGSNNTLDVFPSVDAIAEFRVQTSNYSAVYGRNASGNIEVITKSGTKAFHGDAYEFLRNEAFNANDYFDNAAGNSKPADKKHDFGYTIGGPVFIPHHYNTNKDKTFFFWSEEWRRERNPFSFNQQVPSSAERGGNFNDVCPSQECPIDPNTGLPFPGNNVPIDPNAAVLLGALIPAPTLDNGSNSFFIGSVTEPLTWRQEMIRVDQNIGSKLRLMGRYIHDSYASVDPTVSFVGNPFPSIQTKIGTPGTSFVMHLTATVTPTLLNEFVFSYSADHLSLVNTGPFQVPAGFTMTSLFNTGTGGQTLQQLPAVSLANGAAYGGGFTINPGFMPWINSNPTYGYRDTATKIIRNHNLQFGAELIAIQKNEQSAPTSTGLGGVLSFDEQSPVTTGNSFADFLNGNIASYGQTSAILKYYYRYKILEPYFQDDWHVTKRLTLNLGLRVSLFGTNRDRTRSAFNFEPSVYAAGASTAPSIDSDGSITGVPGALIPSATSNPFVGIVQCGAKGGTGSIPAALLTAFPSATVAGTSLPGCVKGHLLNPGPRIGFAFDPRGNGKSAIRGGYGIFFEYGNGNEANAESLEGTPPKVLTASQPNIAPNGTTCTASSGYTCIGGGDGVFLPFAINNEPPANIVTVARWPYVQQWNLSYQFELPKNFVASIAYVGSKGTHLTDARDLNQLHSLPAAQNPYLPGEAIGPNDCSTFTTPSGAAITGQAATNLNVACGNDPNPTRPFLGFGTLELLETQANSSYNSLQFSARRTLGALIVNVAYTYSHSIDDSSDRGDATFVDSYNLSANRASSNFDQRHILNISYVYDLPFFNKSSRLLKATLGGWEWSGIATFQSGVPVNLSNSVFGDNAGVGNGIGTGSRPDLSGNPTAAACQASTAPGPYLYNPCAYALPQGLTFGNVGRNSLRLPHRTQFDMGLFKRFPIKEAMALEFRAESFNTFNHTQFSGIDTTFDPASTTFLTATSTHLPRVLQLGLKFIF